MSAASIRSPTSTAEVISASYCATTEIGIGETSHYEVVDGDGDGLTIPAGPVALAVLALLLADGIFDVAEPIDALRVAGVSDAPGHISNGLDSLCACHNFLAYWFWFGFSSRRWMMR